MAFINLNRVLTSKRPSQRFLHANYVDRVVGGGEVMRPSSFHTLKDYRVITLISANIVPSLDIEGRELASVSR